MANIVDSMRAIFNVAGDRRVVCADSVVWAKAMSTDPAVIWTQIPRSDWILRMCQILAVDTALLLQAGVDAARVAIAECPCLEPHMAARTADVDAMEAIVSPTNADVSAIVKLCGLCACGGDDSNEARMRRALQGVRPTAVLQQSMADAVRARIPVAKFEERFTDDGEGNLTPIAPVPE